VSPVLALGLGLALVITGGLLLRSVRGYRVARILRSAPEVSIAEALRLATDGAARYVRVHGRITSEEEFPDEQDRPLVFRSRTLEVAVGGRWRVVEQERTGVTFGVRERGDEIAVDGEALGEGLVVVPRESTGSAREIPGRLPAGVPPDALVRHRIEQVSAVEHAVVAGVPVRRDSAVMLTAGLRRPLILSTLEIPDAMRLLSGGQRRTAVVAAALLAAGIGLVVIAALAWLVGGVAMS